MALVSRMIRDLPKAIPVPGDGSLRRSLDEQVMGGGGLQVRDHFMHQFVHVNRFLRQLESGPPACLEISSRSATRLVSIGDLVIHFGQLPHHILPVLCFKALAQELCVRAQNSERRL